MLREEQRRVRRDRGRHVAHDGQRLQIDDDQLGRVRRRGERLGDDRDDTLSDVPNDVDGQRGLGQPFRDQVDLPDRQHGQLGGGEHPADARRRGRGGRLDPGDAGVGDRRADEHQVQPPGGVRGVRDVEVGDEARRAGEQRVVATGCRRGSRHRNGSIAVM